MLNQNETSLLEMMFKRLFPGLPGEGHVAVADDPPSPASHFLGRVALNGETA